MMINNYGCRKALRIGCFADRIHDKIKNDETKQ